MKGPREEVVTINYDEVNGLTAKQTTKFDEILDTIKSSTQTCGDLRGDAFSACVANAIVDDVVKLTDSKTEMKAARDAMATRLRNYTCLDDSLNTSEPINTYNINMDGLDYEVNVLYDKPSSKIWYVDDFITDDECKILIDHGRPRLRRATVAAEDGTSIVSESRKAQQTSYSKHLEQPETDPLW
jgi:hypothetical protein